jgi:hypothetical protein
MLILNDENVPLISQVENARLLGKKLLTSTSDAIEKAQFDAKQLLAIEKPELLLLKANSTKNLFLGVMDIF